MKADIHPNYKEVVFQDLSSDFAFLTRSTLSSKETVKWEDGKEYPLVKIDISSASHPFYTGKQKVMDTGGRVSARSTMSGVSATAIASASALWNFARRARPADHSRVWREMAA